MKIESMHIGMQVRHPQHGLGTVRALSSHMAEIRFDSGDRSLDPEVSELQPAEAQASLSGLQKPLPLLLAEMAEAVVQKMGLEQPDAAVDQLAVRWRHGKLVLHAADPTLQTKEVPLEVFFHKIVMVRNNLRVLEQKINAHPTLTDADKVELQQYITRSYGSLTTFNLLFKSKQDQFSSRE